MAGFAGLGTILRMSSAGGTLATTSTAAGIADLTNISGPSMSAEEIDVSSHDSDGNFREFVAGFLDAGEISLEGNLSTAAQGAAVLSAAFNDRAQRQFHIVFPKLVSTSTAIGDCSALYLRWKFDGTITGVETAAPYDDKATFSSTIRITGAPHLIASSSSGY
jgi:predicted secreted protein